ncbi:hypothetical protein T265_08276 [Opisthorchis viverrini]|uniref:Uncharacterized protein n=1 Tax=Opisthorchis viverrini TaxID=6198 RepID=A0A074Z9S1_OPIVI|nr:hypothetical protein T265_08276 [Opisthorchis viverrini]KER23981.1 hypothetical protein T265_08276 [Opisthorchis viverrini]
MLISTIQRASYSRILNKRAPCLVDNDLLARMLRKQYIRSQRDRGSGPVPTQPHQAGKFPHEARGGRTKLTRTVGGLVD